MNYISGVRLLHKYVGVTCEAMDSHDVKLMQRGIALTHDRELPLRRPITIDILGQLAALCDALHPIGVIYKCVFVLAFFGMLRISNLLPVSAGAFNIRENLCNADVWEHTPGLVIMLRWSKTRQTRRQPHLVGLPRLRNRPDICPVLAYRQYCKVAPLTARGPMFVLPNGTVVTQAMARAALKLLLKHLGLSASLLQFHGFRKGGAQLCYSLGINVEHIKAHGDWASDCVWDYIAPGRYAPSPHVPAALAQRLT